MPIMNGYEASRRIRELKDGNKSQIPIIAMTANAFEEDKKMAFASGMNDHVAKPIDMECIIADYYEIYVKEERRTLILQSVFFLHISRLKKKYFIVVHYLVEKGKSVNFVH